MDQKAFLKKLDQLQKKEGVNIQAVIALKKEVAEGMTAREQALVKYVVNTYLTANFQINDQKTKPEKVGTGEQDNRKDTRSSSDKKES